MKRVYVAGPMRGIPHFNYPAFHRAAKRLRAEGHVVFNPAEQDTIRNGVDVSLDNETGNILEAEIEHGFDLRDTLAHDLEWICRNADAVALLPGWKHSKGATAERAVGEALGLEIIELEDEQIW